MFTLTGLHALAASRGDGLRQDLLELLVQREQVAASNVEDISAHLPGHFIQAGPHPAGRLGTTPPAGVLLFPRATPADTDRQGKQRKTRGY